MIETTERESATHLINQNKEIGPVGDINSAQPEGQASTEFKKFAGAALATPSGFEKNAPPPRRKRGRPRKHPQKNSFVKTDSGAMGGAGTPQLSGQSADMAPAPKPEPISLAQFTSPFLKMVSAIPAAKMQDRRWTLTDDESMKVAVALDPVIQAFIPDLEKMDPKTAAILTLGITIISIYSEKAQFIETSARSTPPKVDAVPTAEAEKKIEPAAGGTVSQKPFDPVKNQGWDKLG